MEGYFLTDRGQVRAHNEDSGGLFYNVNNQLIAIIADGMGGHQAGDVASELAIKLIKEKWETTSNVSVPEEAEAWLSSTILDVNKSIYEHSLKNKECEGMGTTIVAAICTEEFLTIAHVGDSRGYLLNENGFNQVTEDHSLVNELLRSGHISEEDAEWHPRKNVITKAMGTDETVAEDIFTVEWEEGNKLLLCSDGLSDKLNEQEIAAYLLAAKDLEATGMEMIGLANERGGEDNITLIILQYASSLRTGDSE